MKELTVFGKILILDNLLNIYLEYDTYICIKSVNRAN